MIAKALAALLLGLSAMLAATIAAATLTEDWVWVAEWLVPVEGFATGAPCFLASDGLAAWGRGFLLAGAIYSLAAAVLILAPDAVMRDGSEAVVDAASEMGRAARENSSADTQMERATEGVVVGALFGFTGFIGVAFGVVFLVGAALLAGGMHLMLGLILTLMNRRSRIAVGG